MAWGRCTCRWRLVAAGCSPSPRRPKGPRRSVPPPAAHLSVGQQGRQAARVGGGHQGVRGAVHNEHTDAAPPHRRRQALRLRHVARPLRGARAGHATQTISALPANSPQRSLLARRAAQQGPRRCAVTTPPPTPPPPSPPPAPPPGWRPRSRASPQSAPPRSAGCRPPTPAPAARSCRGGEASKCDRPPGGGLAAGAAAAVRALQRCTPKLLCAEKHKKTQQGKKQRAHL